MRSAARRWLARRVPVRRRDTVTKVLASLAVLGIAGAVAGLGTYGAFSDAAPVTTSVQSARVDLTIGVPSGGATIPAPASNFVPGDSMTRAVDVVNVGTVPVAAVTLAVTTSNSNALVTNAANGLQLTVRRCSQAWTWNGSTSAPAYTCGGTETTVLSGSPRGSATVISPGSATPGGRDHLVFTLAMPTTAGNTFQGLSTVVNLTFTGTQLPGAPR